MQRRPRRAISLCTHCVFYFLEGRENFGTPVAFSWTAPAVRGLGTGAGTAGTDPVKHRQRRSEVNAMKWEAPEYNDVRFGFEVTMYINNR